MGYVFEIKAEAEVHSYTTLLEQTDQSKRLLYPGSSRGGWHGALAKNRRRLFVKVSRGHESLLETT